MANKSSSRGKISLSVPADISIPSENQGVHAKYMSPLELAHLTAQLSLAGIVPIRSDMEEPEDNNGCSAQRLITDTMWFYDLCQKAIPIRLEAEVAEKTQWEVQNSIEWTDRPGKNLAAELNEKVLTLQNLMGVIGASRLTLNEQELAGLGINTRWEELQEEERAPAMFRYLCTLVLPYGGTTPCAQTATMHPYRYRDVLGPPEKIAQQAADGYLHAGNLPLQIEVLRKAVELKKTQHAKAAGKKSRLRRTRSASGTFEKNQDLEKR